MPNASRSAAANTRSSTQSRRRVLAYDQLNLSRSASASPRKLVPLNGLSRRSECAGARVVPVLVEESLHPATSPPPPSARHAAGALCFDNNQSAADSLATRCSVAVLPTGEHRLRAHVNAGPHLYRAYLEYLSYGGPPPRDAFVSSAETLVGYPASVSAFASVFRVRRVSGSSSAIFAPSFSFCDGSRKYAHTYRLSLHKMRIPNLCMTPSFGFRS